MGPGGPKMLFIGLPYSHGVKSTHVFKNPELFIIFISQNKTNS